VGGSSSLNGTVSATGYYQTSVDSNGKAGFLFDNGVTVPVSNVSGVDSNAGLTNGFCPGNGDGASDNIFNVGIRTWNGFALINTSNDGAAGADRVKHYWDARGGHYTAKGNMSAAKLTLSEGTGTIGDNNGGTLTLKHNNVGGASSIVFISRNNGTSDYGYVRYRDDVNNGGGETCRLEIGAENDADDAVSIQKNGAGTLIGGSLIVSGAVTISSCKINSTSVGNNNFGLGYNTLAYTTGSNNLAVGYNAGNRGFGSEVAGSATTHGNNVFIGYYAGTSGNFNASTAIGYNARTTADQQVMIGDTTTKTVLGGYSYMNRDYTNPTNQLNSPWPNTFAPPVIMVNGGGGAFPIYGSLGNFQDSHFQMNDIDDVWYVMPGFKLQIWKDFYSGQSITVDNTNSNTIAVFYTNGANNATSCKIWAKDGNEMTGFYSTLGQKSWA
jgi:hypothetical protein